MPPERAPLLFLFAAIFSLYAFCAYPAVAPRDSADLAAAAVSLGVAHPPGYPLYAILGKAWLTALRLANPAYRLNLLSAAAGALAVLSVFAILRRSCGQWAALAGAAAFALSSPLWKFSLLEEKYSLQALFAGTLLYLALDKDDRRFRASALLFGLGLVNHQTLILLGPALLFLWRGRSPGAGPLMLFAAGLSLYAAVWLRLGDAPLAWRVLTRADYGTLTLSSQLTQPLSLDSAWRLSSYFVLGLARAVTWPVALLALIGAVEMWRAEPDLARGLALAFAAFGPLYFLLTRFDVSGWGARAVLEPAFLVPSLTACVAAGFGIRKIPVPAAVLACLIALFCGLDHYAAACHRADFSAYDYAHDLRRFIPPGAAAVVAGDTAQFGLEFHDRVRPEEAAGRAILRSVEEDKRRWIDERMGSRPVYVVGLGEDALKELGLLGNPDFLQPAGPVQRVVASRPAGEEAPWELSVMRPGPPEDSYSRDVAFSYAYARFLSGRLNEFYGWPAKDAAVHFQYAALAEPETYRLERVPQ